VSRGEGPKVSKSGWHNLHLTEDRARAIIQVAFRVALGKGNEPKLPEVEERALAVALIACRAIKYPPQVRGAMGGHAKHGTRPGERPRQEEARAARRAQARQRKLEEEYRIGSVSINRGGGGQV
jgi:hypothetical protein